jgi:hypothetical protein
MFNNQKFTVSKTDNGFIVTMPPKPKQKKEPKEQEPTEGEFFGDIDFSDFSKPQVLVYHKIEDVIEKLKEFDSTTYSEGDSYGVAHAVPHLIRNNVVG